MLGTVTTIHKDDVRPGPAPGQNMLLGEYLIQNASLTPVQLKIALDEQVVLQGHEHLGEILIRLGFCRRDTIIEALSVLNPRALINSNAGNLAIPLSYLKETGTVSLGGSGRYLSIATLDPRPQEVRAHIAELTGRIVDLRAESSVSIKTRLSQEHGPLHTSGPALSLANDENINRVLGAIINEALRAEASDIHLEMTEKALHIRLRVDGTLYIAYVLPLGQAIRLISRIKDLARMDVSQKREPQDGSFTWDYQGKNIDFRVATMPTLHEERVTIRVLNREKSLVSVDELGITKIAEWKSLIASKNGLILVCGATGSGKTTTLYSTIQHLNRLERAVYTIEDPIEYKLPFCTQTQVNLATGLTFAKYTKTVLRHDPNVVIVGETRDSETAHNSIQLADTGHLVFTTLHTNDVPSTLLRLKGMDIDMHHLSFVLRGIMVQRLARKICPTCRRAGCPECRGTGYRGMTLLIEFARISSPEDVDRILNPNGGFPVYTFAMDAQIKIREKITDCDEIRGVLGDDKAMICSGGPCLAGRSEPCM